VPLSALPDRGPHPGSLDEPRARIGYRRRYALEVGSLRRSACRAKYNSSSW